MNSDVPLCVDLTSALLRSNVHIERYLRCVKRNAFFTAAAAASLVRGSAWWRAQLARRCTLEAELLPLDQTLLQWLRAQHERGRRLVLCTDSDRDTAEQIARHIGIFDDVVAADATAAAPTAGLLAQRYGEHRFDYVGRNGSAFAAQARRIVIVPSAGFNGPDEELISMPPAAVERPSRLALWIRALRLHQWAKNLLIFVAAIASHQLLRPTVIRSTIEAFVWFGLCASATYLINDLLDLPSDRAHPRKRLRPFAAGDLPLGHGIVAALLLLAIALAGAGITLGAPFVGALLFYLASTLWYSFVLKGIAMVDVLTLAGLYTVRVIAGSIAISVAPSFWLLAFSMFLFFSLAMIKRYTELSSILADGRSAAAGRGYLTDDLPLMLSCGVAAGFVSVLVLALYVNLGTNGLYRYPQAMWLLCPVLLYWICRMWRKAHRGELHDDPIVFATTDRPSLIVFGACALMVAIAI